MREALGRADAPTVGGDQAALGPGPQPPVAGGEQRPDALAGRDARVADEAGRRLAVQAGVGRDDKRTGIHGRCPDVGRPEAGGVVVERERLVGDAPQAADAAAAPDLARPPDEQRRHGRVRQPALPPEPRLDGDAAGAAVEAPDGAVARPDPDAPACVGEEAGRGAGGFRTPEPVNAHAAVADTDEPGRRQAPHAVRDGGERLQRRAGREGNARCAAVLDPYEPARRRHPDRPGVR